MYDPEALREGYRRLQPGDPTMRAIRAAIAEADRAGDPLWSMQFHSDLIRESVFSGDRYQALVDFPQYLALTKANPELAAQNIRGTLWMFKWIVEAAPEFYQIDKPQILRWFSEFRRELTLNGFSLKPLYEKRAIFYSFFDRARLRLDFEDFLRAPEDEMSDGEADACDSIVRWRLVFGDRDGAMQAAERIFSQHLTGGEVPATTYGYLLEDALSRGDLTDAAHWAALDRPLCEGQRMRLEQIGLLMRYDAVTDPESGLQFYRRHADIRESSRNPFLCFWFDFGAWRLLTAAQGAGLTLPDGDIAARAADHRRSAGELAEKFDARNGSDFFSRLLT